MMQREKEIGRELEGGNPMFLRDPGSHCSREEEGCAFFNLSIIQAGPFLTSARFP